MKYYSLIEMTKELIEEFDIEDCKFNTIKQKISRTAKEYPVSGKASYFNLAQASGKKYTKDQYLEIKRICESYLCERSSNEKIKEGNYYSSIRDARVQIIQNQKRDAFVNALDEAYKKHLPSYKCYELLPFNTVFEDFINDNGRDPNSESEFIDYFENYMEKKRYLFHHDGLNNEGEDIWRLFIGVGDPAIPISDKDKKILDSDYHYEPIWEIDEYAEDGVRITGMRKRSYTKTEEQWRMLRLEMKLEAIYSVFYKPIDDEKLKEDIHKTLTEYEPHQQQYYYAEAINNLKDHRNYCERKMTSSDENLGKDFFDEMKKAIIQELKDYMDEWANG